MKNKFLLSLAFLIGIASFAQNPQPVTGSLRYNNIAVDQKLAIPNDTLTPTSYFATRPLVAALNDSVLYLWSPSLNKYVIAKTSAGAVSWGDITGLISANSQLIDSLNARMRAFPTGTSAQYIKGDLSLGTFYDAVIAVGDPRYAGISHTHIFSNITDGTPAVRNLFSAGTGISYNPSTGIITATGSVSTAWGDLTGTLTNQTDLYDSLLARVPKWDSVALSGYATQYDLTQLSFPDTHMGNTNLTQTAGRTYTGTGFDYYWDNIGNWEFAPASGADFRWYGNGTRTVEFDAQIFFVDIAGGAGNEFILQPSSVELYTAGGQDGYFRMFEDLNQADWEMGAAVGGNSSRILMNQGAGSRGIFITSDGTSESSQIDLAEGAINLFGENLIQVSSLDSILFDLEPSATKVPFRIYGLPITDTASMVVTAAWQPGENSIRLVLQDKSTLGGGTIPTLQEVIEAGYYVHDTSIYIGQNFLFRWDFQGSGNPVGQYNGGTNSMVFFNIGANRGINLDWSILTDAIPNIFKFREGNGGGIDTLATLYDIRTGGSIPTLQQVLDAGSTINTTESIILTGGSLFNFDIGANSYVSFTNSVASPQPVSIFSRVTDNTNSTNYVSRFDVFSTGTVANGFGGTIGYVLENASGGTRTANEFKWKFTNATAGSETSQIDIEGVDNGGGELFMNIQANGIVRVNDNADTLATKAYARSVGGGGGGGGTVTDFIFTDGNGFDGTVTNSTSTPTLSLTTTVGNTQVMFSNNGAVTGSSDFKYISADNSIELGTGDVVAGYTDAIAMEGSIE